MVCRPAKKPPGISMNTKTKGRQETALGRVAPSCMSTTIRLPLELPAGVFTESGVLERELRLGARYPESRSGNIDASVVTGRGVQALRAGFDTQIKAAQAQFARMFQELVSVCFEADEKIFGGIPKTIKGSDDGTPYVLKYTPSRDIKGEYGVDVRY